MAKVIDRGSTTKDDPIYRPDLLQWGSRRMDESGEAGAPPKKAKSKNASPKRVKGRRTMTRKGREL